MKNNPLLEKGNSDGVQWPDLRGTQKIKLKGLDGSNVRSKGKGMSRIILGFWNLNYK